MKNKKKNKAVHQNSLATGIFKKTFWPWLFVIAAVVILAYTYECLLVEFYSSARICGDNCCKDFYAYLFHYEKFIDTLWIVAAALVLVAILCAILFVRKRKLVVEGDAITYKKGGKVNKIPFTSVKNVTVKKNTVTITVPYKKFKIKRLKNAKQIYEAINALLYPTQAQAAEAQVAAAPKSIDELPFTVGINLPTSAQSKILYFQNLLASKTITPEQYEAYTNKVLATELPEQSK